MLQTDPKTAHFPVDPNRLDLVEEFRRAPKGPYSPDLQKIVHRMRWGGEGGRFVLIPVEPGKKWMLGLLPSRRGDAVKTFSDKTFTRLADAEWAVFKIRWEAITGVRIAEETDQKP
ncbi:hypothetical protein QBK99_22990 [Corticibacterium sp. UT-5YL-CI-8]|nr:hypothetical protein [Tianweitania sp. UT-5YL-CI-8]